VDETTAKRLTDINRLFYQTFALQFSQTRRRLQPGIKKILDNYLPAKHGQVNILDLGCGNGELAQELDRRDHQGLYVGLDFSSELLAEAQNRTYTSIETVFLKADLSARNWGDENALITLQEYPPFDFVFAFAVLHHIPGESRRRQILSAVRHRLAPKGVFVHSVWQFLNSPRLRERIQAWEKVGLSGEMVDPGDYLLDWRQGGAGLRYVHHFEPDELASLAMETGFEMVETFLSDGEGGNLGLYQIWTCGKPGTEK
jgi:tRNA (uracil-5-)-methyltransferase TRM9